MYRITTNKKSSTKVIIYTIYRITFTLCGKLKFLKNLGENIYNFIKINIIMIYNKN